MMIHFSHEEQAHLQIRQVARRPLSDGYLTAREQGWTRRQQRAATEGTHIWNGEIYTIERILQYDEQRLVLEMATCEFKDIVYRVQEGVEAIEGRHGSDHVMPFVTVDCLPMTADGKLVFGVRSRGTTAQPGTLGLIGGTLNRDEMVVERFADIGRFMAQEISEETSLPVRISQLVLFSLNFFRAKYEFLYTCKLDASARDLAQLCKPGEFVQLLALAPQDLDRLDMPQLDAVRYCRNYLLALMQWYNAQD